MVFSLSPLPLTSAVKKNNSRFYNLSDVFPTVSLGRFQDLVHKWPGENTFSFSGFHHLLQDTLQDGAHVEEPGCLSLFMEMSSGPWVVVSWAPPSTEW